MGITRRILVLVPLALALAHASPADSLAERAKEDARSRTNGIVYLIGGFGAGFLGNILGASVAMGLTAVSNPSPPDQVVMELPEDQLALYTAHYRNTARDIQLRNVTIGTSLGLLVLTGFFLTTKED